MNQIKMNKHKEKKIAAYIVFIFIFFNTRAQYTLQSKDVIINQGIITECVTDTSDWGTNEIIIPSVIDNQTVVGIADKEHNSGVFERKGIRKVVLPETLKTIGDWAFQNNLLTGINFPASIDSIKNYVFAHNYFEVIGFQSNCSLKFIGNDAFAYNLSQEGVDSIKFPKSLNYIESCAFYGQKINRIIFEKNSSLKHIGICAFDGSRVTYLSLPDSLEYIGDLAFIRNSLSEINLPEMISFIGAYAFAEGRLASIDLPSPVIKEDSVFVEWQNSNGTVVNKITNHSLSYTAKFDLSETAVYMKEYAGGVKVFPNPFTSFTTLSYELKVNSYVILIVYDSNGRKIQMLVNQYQNAGDYTISFNGAGLSEGIYYYQLSVGDSVKVKKMVLIK